MNVRILFTALLLAVGSSAALTNASAAEAAPAKAEAAKDEAAKPAAAADADRMICRQEKPVGSNIPKRTCKTAAQWEADREAARKMMQDLQQRTGSTSSR